MPSSRRWMTYWPTLAGSLNTDAFGKCVAQTVASEKVKTPAETVLAWGDRLQSGNVPSRVVRVAISTSGAFTPSSV
jgi:hypothetical protein